MDGRARALAAAGILLCVALIHPSNAQAGGSEAIQADSTDVYETVHYPVLELPQTVWTWLVYPLGQATIYAENEKLPKKVREWFMNEEQTFGLFPQVQLGGETSTSAGG